MTFTLVIIYDSPMVVTLGQQYYVGDRPTVILSTNISRYAGTPFVVLSIRSMLLQYYYVPGIYHYIPYA